jgi:uncharacterized membrane protein
MKEAFGDITASMLMGVMLFAFALGIAFVLSLETLKLSKGEVEFYKGENGNVLELWEAR